MQICKKAVGFQAVIDVPRPADLPGQNAELRAEVGALAETEEDVLTYAMFLKWRSLSWRT